MDRNVARNPVPRVGTLLVRLTPGTTWCWRVSPPLAGREWRMRTTAPCDECPGELAGAGQLSGPAVDAAHSPAETQLGVAGLDSEQVNCFGILFALRLHH